LNLQDNFAAGFKHVVAGAKRLDGQAKLALALLVIKGYGLWASMSLPSKARLRRAVHYGVTLLESTLTADQLLGKAGWSATDIAEFGSDRCGGLGRSRAF